ncbi:hypothetical protein [Mesorhizobium helmanticense]|uniref:Uncharacterized protein n=1 Tax=Mesorhizobium helmanticense TaxID=1776423 RepID=A0A2T4J327_9HYPH|nr:hypothetical protein [Mesorhizobium helmanticense]PTE12263.1 hypothetical protein C9427_01350 [Mesorhizobium helmanticense]
MTAARRADHIYQRAYLLAESGAHDRAAEIVAMLVTEGYPEAVDLLNTDNIRADLRRACEVAAPRRPRLL